MKYLKNFSWTWFLLILICLIMPFTSVSCGDQKVLSLSGAQLVTGASYTISGETQKIPANPFVIGAAGAALLGLLILLIIKNKITFSVGMMANIVTAVLLIIYKLDWDNQTLKQGEGMLTVSYDFGYWMMFITSVLAAIYMGVMISVPDKKQEDEK